MLGLAVHPEAEKKNLNYVWMLKNAGYIDSAMVSFSVSGPEIEDQSYAIFGGLNPDQIVGGTAGLRKMQTMAYRPDWTNSMKQWALEGQKLWYGDKEAPDLGKIPAIIDTGSSNLGVPGKAFNFLKESW